MPCGKTVGTKNNFPDEAVNDFTNPDKHTRLRAKCFVYLVNIVNADGDFVHKNTLRMMYIKLTKFKYSKNMEVIFSCFLKKQRRSKQANSDDKDEIRLNQKDRNLLKIANQKLHWICFRKTSFKTEIGCIRQCNTDYNNCVY